MSEWREIPGYEGQYEVSDHGQVRALERIDAAGNRRKAKAMSSFLVKGYPKVSLTKNGVSKPLFVHRLMLLAFVGEPRDGQVACHNDGNPLNCTISNLRWDTQKENWRDSVRHGIRRSGICNPHAKHNAVDIERVRDLHCAGVVQNDISSWLGISKGNVWNIIHWIQRFALN